MTEYKLVVVGGMCILHFLVNWSLSLHELLFYWGQFDNAGFKSSFALTSILLSWYLLYIQALSSPGMVKVFFFVKFILFWLAFIVCWRRHCLKRVKGVPRTRLPHRDPIVKCSWTTSHIHYFRFTWQLITKYLNVSCSWRCWQKCSYHTAYSESVSMECRTVCLAFRYICI